MVELPNHNTSESDDPEAGNQTEPAHKPRLGCHFTRLICTHNPFYLLSVCFVLHGTGLQMNNAHERHEPLPLFLLICSYILMMSLTAVTVVRKAKLWEDARSILLLVPVLLVELSLTLDDPLITDPVLGRLLVVGAFLFSVMVLELLLHGLKLRLPVLYRLPLHCLMGVIILYPLMVIPAIHQQGLALSVQWRNFLFGPVSAIFILSLIPAIRRGADYVRDNGTPWGWPLYPWTIFVFLILAVGARGFSLTLSFDPVLEQSLHQAMALDSTWGWYFLAPILLAVAFLIMEFGIVTNRMSVSFVAMLLPAASCWLIFQEANQSLPYHNFLEEFMRVAPSPLYLALCGSTLFYFLALMRHQPLAVPAFVTSVLAFAIVGVDTIGFDSFTRFQPLPLMLVGSVLLAKGLIDRRSGRFIFGVAGVTFWICCEFQPYWSLFLLCLIFYHAMLIALLIAGIFFTDSLSENCLWAGVISLAVGSFLAILNPFELPHWTPEWGPLVYSFGLASIALVISYPLKQRVIFSLGGIMLASTLLETGRLLIQELQLMINWRGLGSLVIGFLLLLFAMLVSAAKAGFLKGWRVILPKHSG
jgi:hypothetical protein